MAPIWAALAIAAQTWVNVKLVDGAIDVIDDAVSQEFEKDDVESEPEPSRPVPPGGVRVDEDRDEQLRVYRTSREDNGQDEVDNGINPTRHETEIDGVTPGSAWVGEYRVAARFRGAHGYERKMIYFDVDRKKFEAHPLIFESTYAGSGGTQWEIMFPAISDFNSMTSNRGWVD